MQNPCSRFSFWDLLALLLVLFCFNYYSKDEIKLIMNKISRDTLGVEKVKVTNKIQML